MYKQIFILLKILTEINSNPCKIQPTPININPPLFYKPLKINYNFEKLIKIDIKKLKSNLYKITNDFGILKINENAYKINNIEFKRNSRVRISNNIFDLEMLITGETLSKKKIQIVVLFEKSKNDNNLLYDIGFGRGVFKKKKNNSSFLVDRFDLNLYFKENSENNFLYFNGQPVYSPKNSCEESLWLIFYLTFDISQRQLDDFNFLESENELINDINEYTKIYKNVDDNTSYINLIKKNWQPKNYLKNLVVDNNLEMPKFSYNKKPLKKQKKKNKLDFVTTFLIYTPVKNKPWGYIPKNSIMPWEKENYNLESQNIKIIDIDPVISPLENYYYIPFFYYKTPENSKKNDKIIYIPYLILVKKGTPLLDFPVNNVDIYIPGLDREVNLKIQRGEKINEVSRVRGEEEAVKVIKESDFDKVVDHKKKVNESLKNKEEEVLNNKEGIFGEDKDEPDNYTKIINDINEKNLDEDNFNKDSLNEQIIKEEKRLKAEEDQFDEKKNTKLKQELQKETKKEQKLKKNKKIYKIKNDKIQINQLLADFKNKKKIRNPRLKIKIHYVPMDCILSHKKLPTNSGILDLDKPIFNKFKNFKTNFQILYLCPVNIYSIRFDKVFVPIWYLLYKKMHFNKKKYRKQKYPFIVKKNFHSNNYIVSYKKLKFIPKKFEDVIKNKKFLDNLKEKFGFLKKDVFRKKYKLKVFVTKKKKSKKLDKEIIKLKNSILKNNNNVNLAQYPLSLEEKKIINFLTN